MFGRKEAFRSLLLFMVKMRFEKREKEIKIFRFIILRDLRNVSRKTAWRFKFRASRLVISYSSTNNNVKSTASLMQINTFRGRSKWETLILILRLLSHMIVQSDYSA